MKDEERQLAMDIFLSFFLQRFKNKTTKQIRNMITEFVPLRETKVGKELVEEVTEKVTQEVTQEVTREVTREYIRLMHESGLTVKRIAKITKLTEKKIRGYLKVARE